MGSFLLYPFSIGDIHITSKNVYSDSDFNASFLSHPADLAPHVWAYKKNREITRRMRCFSGEYAPSHPAFPEGSAAVCQETPFPKSERNDVPGGNFLGTMNVGVADTGVPLQGTSASGIEQSIRDIEYTEEDDQAIVQWIRRTLATTWHSLYSAIYER
jgi:alcohol oxidase